MDAVINNAGQAGIGVTEAYTPDQFQQMFDNVPDLAGVQQPPAPA